MTTRETEARARVGSAAASGSVPAAVLADAESQVAAMLAGLDDLLAAMPALAEPPTTTAPSGATATPTRAAPAAAGTPAAAGALAAPPAAPPAEPNGSSALHALSLEQLAGLLRRREVSPVEATRAVLDRIAAYDGRLCAFILVTADQALDAARQAEREIAAGAYRGPLHGVPLAAKDLYDVRSVPTTAGSAIFRSTPPDDSAAVAAWRAAGAVLLGKNTLHEFAFGGTSVNQHTGTPRNPWHVDHTCGGSSGGSAAAVAAGFAYGALGSETGNSVRRPAAFCGVLGLKPTFGRCSRRGVFPLAWSLDHVGAFARTPRDAALLAAPLTGFDPMDPGSRRAPAGAADMATRLDVRGLRVGVPRALVAGGDPHVLAAFERAVDALRGAGVEVRDVDLPLASRWTALTSSVTMQAEAATVHARWVRERPRDYGADVLARLLAGGALQAADYARAQAARGAIREELHAALREIDAFVAPGTPAPAPPLQGGALVSGDSPFGTTVTSFQLQRLWSLTGLPAVAAPAGLHPNGLPVSIQLAGRPWEEGVLLGLAAVASTPLPVPPLTPAGV